MNCGKKLGTLLVVVGGVILILCLVVLIAFPALYKKQLEVQTTLEENTILFNFWKELPVPVYQKVYYFNITNQEEFVNVPGTPLKVEEVGPYTYVGRWKKKDIRYENGTVSYREVKTYYFNRDKSSGSEDDVIHTLNGFYVAAAHRVGGKPEFLQILANIGFKTFGENLIIQKTVKELTFEGYEDKLLNLTKNLFPSPFTDGKFAWLYGKNATDEGLFKVFTGKNDRSKLNVIKEWNGESQLKYWTDGPCNLLNGTNAEFGPPYYEGQTKYTFFQPFLCRSITFNYDGDQIHKGVRSKRFQSTGSIFENEDDNSDNYCFVNDQILPSGVLDISSCQFDAPVLLSFPHFYLADPYYFNIVDGLRPIEFFHKSYIDIEPITGITVGLAMRFQINLRIYQNELLHEFGNITSGIYPVLWVEMSTEIDDNLSQSLDRQMRQPKRVTYSVLGTLSTISLGFLLWGFKLLKWSSNRMWEEKKPLVDQEKPITYSSFTPRVEPVGGSAGVTSNTIRTQGVSSASASRVTSCFIESCNVHTKKISVDSLGEVTSERVGVTSKKTDFSKQK